MQRTVKIKWSWRGSNSQPWRHNTYILAPRANQLRHTTFVRGFLNLLYKLVLDQDHSIISRNFIKVQPGTAHCGSLCQPTGPQQQGKFITGFLSVCGSFIARVCNSLFREAESDSRTPLEKIEALNAALDLLKGPLKKYSAPDWLLFA